MRDIKNEVLELFENSSQGYSFKELEEKLNIQSSSDFAILSKTMDQLESDYYIVRTKNNTYTLAENDCYISGVIHINRKGVGYIDLEDSRSIMIETENLNDALDKDTVVVELNKRNYQYVVVAVREHHINHVTGTFKLVNGNLKCVLDDEKLVNHPYKINFPKNFKMINGLRVFLKIKSYGRLLELEYDETIGFKDDPGVDIQAILMSHDINSAFPEDVEKEIQEIPDEVTEAEKEGRVDLTSEKIITIDGDDSKDFDDAIGVTKTDTGWNLKVSIADVSHYVKEGSPIDQEAYKRGTSTYVTDRVVPMLPQLLSNGICSLNPHVVRLTLTCDMEVNTDGSISSYKIYPSFIRSFERMTYRNVNKILDGETEVVEKYTELNEMIKDLRDCADAIRMYRHEKGEIEFDTEESEIIVNEKGHPIDIRLRQRGHAERMVEDCMIAANVSVANYMNENHIPALYRIHEEPEIKKLKSFQETSFVLGSRFPLTKANVTPKEIQSYLEKNVDKDIYPVLSFILLRCMQKAKYDPTCIGHFGLAEKEYLHFTSPIRRYPDLIVHRMLRKYVFENDWSNLENDTQKISDYALQTSLRERESIDAEREVDDMKKAEYMEERIGNKYDAIITSVTGFGFYAELDNTVEGLVSINDLIDDYYRYDERTSALIGERTRKQYRIGDKVKVVVLSASKETHKIDFGLTNLNHRRKEQSHPTKHKDMKKERYKSRGNKHGKRRR